MSNKINYTAECLLCGHTIVITLPEAVDAIAQLEGERWSNLELADEAWSDGEAMANLAVGMCPDCTARAEEYEE